jgi:colanic acid biosynthesis protein WcaH
MLSPENYITAIELTQIVSVDFIVYNKDNKVLIGKRRNRPAKGTYFVPGGRIFKGESIKQGIIRQFETELGISLENVPKIKYISDHIYEDNFTNKPISTHYVCIAVEIKLEKELDNNTFNIQHEDVLWLTPEEILKREDVNIYTRYYFIDNAPNRLDILK